MEVTQSDALMRSQNNLRDINTFMQQYNSNDARILPSQFDRYDEAGEADAPSIGGAASRMSYTLTEQGAEWIENNNPYRSQGGSDLGSGPPRHLGGPDLGGGEPRRHAGGRRHVHRRVGRGRRFRSLPFLQVLGPGPHLLRGQSPVGQEPAPQRGREHLELAPVGQQRRPDRLQPLRGGDDLGRRTARSSHAAGFRSLGEGLRGLLRGQQLLRLPRSAARDISGDAGDSARDRSWAEGQIKSPNRSLYLVDSFAGETIGGTPGFLGTSDYADQQVQYYEDTSRSFEVAAELDVGLDGSSTEIGEGRCNQEVDFRYGNQCLMLFLDGHVEQQERWSQIWDLEGRRTTPSGGASELLDLDKRQARPQ